MLHGGRGVQTRRMTRVHTFQSVEQMLARRALPRSTAAAGRPSPRSTTKPAGGGAQQQIIGQGASEPVEGGGEAARPGRFWPVPPTPSTSASSGSAGASASPGTVTGEAAPDTAPHSSLIDMDAEGRGTKGRKVKGRWETRCLLVRPCVHLGKVFTRRIHIKIGFYKPQIKHIHSYNLKCGRAVALLRRRQSR